MYLNWFHNKTITNEYNYKREAVLINHQIIFSVLLHSSSKLFFKCIFPLTKFVPKSDIRIKIVIFSKYYKIIHYGEML